MTLSDAEKVAMWPRIPFGTCTICRHQGPATWTSLGFNLLCDSCLEGVRDGG